MVVVVVVVIVVVIAVVIIVAVIMVFSNVHVQELCKFIFCFQKHFTYNE